jgi:hypothetical protein
VTLTVHELIELLEAILQLIRKARHPPPAAVKDLYGAVNRSNNMATATLTWTNPTTRVDGSPLAATDIGGINVFDSAAPDPTVPIASLLAVTSFTTGTLTVGAHSFTVVVVDTTGHSSAPSNVVTVTVAATLSNPSPVTDLAAVLNP